MGVILKGTPPDFDWSFFDRYLTAGQLPAFNDSVASNQILISKTIADKMRLQTGDAVFAYFIKDKVRARKFTVSGIYHTGFSEYDQMFILGDARQLQRLNNWNPDQYSGIEILLHDFDALEQTTFDLYADLLDYSDEYGTYYYPQSIRQISPTFFGWLDLLDFNVWIILILMSAVAGFTMISGLLIIILERVRKQPIDPENIFIRIRLSGRERTIVGQPGRHTSLPYPKIFQSDHFGSGHLLRLLCTYRTEHLPHHTAECGMFVRIIADVGRTLLPRIADTTCQVH